MKGGAFVVCMYSLLIVAVGAQAAWTVLAVSQS